MLRPIHFIDSVYYSEAKKIKINDFDQFDKLPSDIWVKIFKSLEFSKFPNSEGYSWALSAEYSFFSKTSNNYLQYLKIALVSWKFKHLASDVLISSINEKKIYIDRNIENLVKEYGEKFQLLTPPNIKLDLIERCLNLTELNLAHSQIIGNKILKTFSKVLKLTLPTRKIGYGELVSFSKCFPNITQLNASGSKLKRVVFFDAIHKYFPQLTSLHIDPQSDTGNDDIDEIENFTQEWIENDFPIEKIEELSIGNDCGSNVTSECIPLILKTFPNLKILNLADSTVNFEGAMDREDLFKSERLKDLDLFGINITEKDFWRIVKLYPNLERLCIDFDSEFSQRFLRDGIAPLKLLTKLKTLDIELIVKVDDQDPELMEFRKALPNVQVLLD